MCRGLSALRTEAEKALAEAEATADVSGSELADVCQRVVVSSFGQLAWFELYYQLCNDFF